MKEGIETRYAGALFRSRLEARWAAMFDLMQWRWEYEPIDLDGYIPDFILQFYRPLLAEVKPVLSVEECAEHARRINRSEWQGDAVILGATLAIGGSERWGFCEDGICYYGQVQDDGSRYWAKGHFHLCRKCGLVSFHHEIMDYKCVVSGCHDGDHYLGELKTGVLNEFWRKAGAITQWKAK